MLEMGSREKTEVRSFKYGKELDKYSSI